jgi:hypothetical protein
LGRAEDSNKRKLAPEFAVEDVFMHDHYEQWNPVPAFLWFQKRTLTHPGEFME